MEIKMNTNYEKQLARVMRMEALCDEITEILTSNKNVKKRLTEQRDKILELEEYYEGFAWREDFEAEKKGVFPSYMKRGILSEDTLYDLFCDIDRAMGDSMKQYIVDAFTKEAFKGNPAAVCVMKKWPTEEFMKNLAAENNLSETAFIVKEEKGYHLRWFTPTVEVEICGHATLASAFVILNFYDIEAEEVKFNTLSGELIVRKVDDMLELDFPRYELKEIPVTEKMEAAFGIRPIKAILGLDLVCFFENEEQVRNMTPSQELLKGIEGRIQNATAKGSNTDCVSRSFCPKLGIEEDPVCGSAHCAIADAWARELKKEEIYAYQASKRGGYLKCRILSKDRIAIRGDATLISIAELKIEF